MHPAYFPFNLTHTRDIWSLITQGGSVMSVLGYLSKPQSAVWAATTKTDAVSVSLIQQLFEHRATL
jgi:hypothetical protein